MGDSIGSVWGRWGRFGGVGITSKNKPKRDNKTKKEATTTSLCCCLALQVHLLQLVQLALSHSLSHSVSVAAHALFAAAVSFSRLLALCLSLCLALCLCSLGDCSRQRLSHEVALLQFLFHLNCGKLTSTATSPLQSPVMYNSWW